MLTKLREIPLRIISLIGLLREAAGALRLLQARRLDPGFRVSAEFFPEEEEIRTPNIGTFSPSNGRMYPALRGHRLKKARVVSNRRCSAVVSDSNFLIPSSALEGPWRINFGKPVTGGIIWQKDNLVLVDLGKKLPSIEAGIFVGTWSPNNWFHWTIDILPSVWLAGKLPPEFSEFPILLPAGYDTKASWLEPLELVLGGRKIVELPRQSYVRVEDLVWIDSPSAPGANPRIESDSPRYSLHGSAINAYRKHLIEAAGIDEGEVMPERRIYLARASGGNRPDNQDELISIANSYGYEPVFFETLDLRAAIETMLSASFIIGPHGAGWANALFCKTGIRAFMWTWQESLRDNWFANIAAVREMNFESSLKMKRRGNGWYMDPIALREHLSAIHP